jgi:hypothetical protein
VQLAALKLPSRFHLPPRTLAVSTREYQTDQSSLNTAPTAARSVLEKSQKATTKTKATPRIAQVDMVTPYQADALIEAAEFIFRIGLKT